MNMWEPFWALYKENEDYHNVKENAIWTAFSLYLSFVIGSFVWYFSQECVLYLNICMIILIEICIGLFTIIFIFFQNLNKTRSVEITNRMNTLLGKMDKDITFEELKKQFCWPNGTTKQKERKESYYKYGYIGNTLILLIFVLIIAKLCYLAKYF